MALSLTPHALRTPLSIPFLRGEPRNAARRGIRLAALRMPLAAKLVGANLAVVALLLAAWNRLYGPLGSAPLLVAAIAVVGHVVLVFVALRPIRELEVVAARVWQGDYAARVGHSMIADDEVLRVGAMFNILLDGLAAEQARLRALAADVIEAGDRERAALAHELQETTAQHLAALLFELAVVARDTSDPLIATRLRSARDATESILDEVRVLSRTVHPSVLDNLGLEAALKKLAREASLGNVIEFDVDADLGPARLPANVESTMYRAAQEAVRNSVRHASPTRIQITARRQHSSAVLLVRDDGAGFDAKMSASKPGRRGRGLDALRERLALVDGWLEVESATGAGTTVSATVTLDALPEVSN